MKKSRIDTKAIKDFATSIKRKLSQQPPVEQEPAVAVEGADDPDLLQTILAACREIASTESDTASLARVTIAELVLPKVFHPGSGGTRRVNHEQAKAFAFACGQIAGLLAGLSLQEPAIDTAIDEVCEHAKQDAHRTVRILNKHGFTGVPTEGAPVMSTDGVTPAEQSKQDSTTAQLAMIDDLERQAASEADLAHAAALRVMASNMKRELFARASEGEPKKDAA